VADNSDVQVSLLMVKMINARFRIIHQVFHRGYPPDHQVKC